MATWKTSNVFIKNMIGNAWGIDEVTPFIGSDENIKQNINNIHEELFHEGIDLQFEHWTPRDYEKIRVAAILRVKELNALDE